MAETPRRSSRERWPTVADCDLALAALAGALRSRNIFDAQLARLHTDDILDRRLELMRAAERERES